MMRRGERSGLTGWATPRRLLWLGLAMAALTAAMALNWRNAANSDAGWHGQADSFPPAHEDVFQTSDTQGHPTWASEKRRLPMPPAEIGSHTGKLADSLTHGTQRTAASLADQRLAWQDGKGGNAKDAEAPPVPAPADTDKAPDGTAAKPGTTQYALDSGQLPSVVELFRSSLIINSIILTLSVIALLSFVYFLLTVNHNSMVPAPLVDDVMKMVLDKEYKQAVEYCRHHRGIFVSSIIQRCVENADKEHAVLMEMADTEGRRRADILWNRISYLSDIANVAPMLGLLGTVVGMIGAFFGLDQADISIKSKVLSSQIAGAMATTMFGLIVAILALFFFSIVKGRATRVLAEAEQAVHAVADHIKRGSPT